MALREIREDDAEALSLILGDAATVTPYGADTRSMDEVQQYVTDARRAAEQDPRDRYILAAETLEGGELIGIATLELGPYRSAMVGGLVRRDLWRSGNASEGIVTMIDFGFRKLGLHRIWGCHDSTNPASGMVMAKVGMTYEGTRRDAAFVHGQWIDSSTYAVLEHEWTGV
ncbi:GNAT family N-acetyltransferase [Streptomyces sp. NPDC056400]|uniref:GNAT family N-acetyltransferase n=1 Tax=Streptomyces sp. NPDC056400 TaxID=3345808 RepID=UPI0035E05EB4